MRRHCSPGRAFLLASVSGYALFWVLGKYVYHLCPRLLNWSI